MSLQLLNPLLWLQRQVAKLASELFYYWPSLRNNNMATNLRRCTSSQSSRRFAVCSHWTQTSWQVMRQWGFWSNQKREPKLKKEQWFNWQGLEARTTCKRKILLHAGAQYFRDVFVFKLGSISPKRLLSIYLQRTSWQRLYLQENHQTVYSNKTTKLSFY